MKTCIRLRNEQPEGLPEPFAHDDVRYPPELVRTFLAKYTQIEVSNLKKPGSVTPLAWDIAHTISQVLHFQGEVVVQWEPTYGYGYDHSYCLLFTRPSR